MQPPLLPVEALPRVLRLARMDGMGVLMVATFFALTSAGLGDLRGAVVWLLVAGAGAIELHGAALLRQFEVRGMNWLVGSQVLFVLAVFGHCALRLANYDPTAMREALTPEMKATLAQANYAQEEFLRTVYVITYGGLATVAFVYKSSIALYFHRRRAAVAVALNAE